MLQLSLVLMAALQLVPLALQVQLLGSNKAYAEA